MESSIIILSFFKIEILIPKQMVPACLLLSFFFFKDPKQDSMKIIMERFHQKLMEVMLFIKLTYAGNKLVELMHLNARVAKPNLSSSSRKENSFFFAKEEAILS